MGICLHGFKMDLTMNLMVAQWNMIRMTWIHNIDRLDWIGLDWIRFLVGGFKHVLCSIIYGMSSFPLTHIFQDGDCTTNHLLFHHHVGELGLFDNGGDPKT